MRVLSEREMVCLGLSAAALACGMMAGAASVLGEEFGWKVLPFAVTDDEAAEGGRLTAFYGVYGVLRERVAETNHGGKWYTVTGWADPDCPVAEARCRACAQSSTSTGISMLLGVALCLYTVTATSSRIRCNTADARRRCAIAAAASAAAFLNAVHMFQSYCAPNEAHSHTGIGAALITCAGLLQAVAAALQLLWRPAHEPSLFVPEYSNCSNSNLDLNLRAGLMPSSAGPVQVQTSPIQQITTATPFTAAATTPKFCPVPAITTAAAAAASTATSAKLFRFNRQHPTTPTTTSPIASSFSTGANTKRRFPRIFGGDATEAVPPPADSRERVKAFLMGLQDKICAELSEVDGGSFEEESWERPEGGGGRSRVLMGGEVFEQAGVNFSEVQGSVLPPSILDQHPEAAGHAWFATGVSLVIHPRNPYIPTVHLNYRYFEAGPAWWFGGGADLTPYYPFLSDVRDWHSTIKEACDSVDENYYPVFNKWCDEYFYLKHRKETRGVGGIFYDYQDHKGKLYSGLQEDGPGAAADAQVGKAEHDWEKLFKLHQACGGSFLPSYLPIVNKRHPTPYGEKERDFQLYRRGRYVEFNLVFDRGTIFGLQTNGRTESILMSLPPLVRWEYGYTPPPNSREALLFEDFLHPRDWHGDKQLEDKCESLGALA